MHGIISKARLAAVLAASAAAIAPTTARADDACPSSTADAYSMTAGALTGPSKTDVTLTVAAAPGCEPATCSSTFRSRRSRPTATSPRF